MSANSSSSSCSCRSGMSSSATSASSGSSTPDKFYGHKELAEFSEHVVADLFCLTSPLSETPPLRSPRVSKRSPPRLAEFMAYAIYRTRLAGPIVHQALFYLQRLKARYPAARGTESSPHRLFLSALMLAAKMSMDDCYSNKSWTIVGGNLFSLKEVNQMERELFAFLNFNLSCDHNELDSFVNDRQLEWEAMKTAAKSAHHPYLCYPRELLISQRKRRTSDSNSREHALRHKRASDAAVALLRSSQHKTTLSHSDLQKATQAPTRSSYSCRSTPPISYSASLSPSEASTSYSPLSIHHTVSPEMSDVCDSSPQQSASKPSRAIH